MKKTRKKLVAIALLFVIIATVVSLLLVRHNAGSSESTQDTGYGKLTYEQYNELSATEQEEFFNSFETIDAFFAWYNKAKEEYEENQDYTEIGDDGDIGIGEGGKN